MVNYIKYCHIEERQKKDEELIFDYNYDRDDCSINFHDGSGDIPLDSCVGTIHHAFTKEYVYTVNFAKLKTPLQSQHKPASAY